MRYKFFVLLSLLLDEIPEKCRRARSRGGPAARRKGVEEKRGSPGLSLFLLRPRPSFDVVGKENSLSLSSFLLLLLLLLFFLSHLVVSVSWSCAQCPVRTLHGLLKLTKNFDRDDDGGGGSGLHCARAAAAGALAYSRDFASGFLRPPPPPSSRSLVRAIVPSVFNNIPGVRTLALYRPDLSAFI